jgi:hypothetical protein
MNSEEENIGLIKLLWVCSICWFLLTGYEWTEILTQGTFKILYLCELLLFISSLSFLFSFSNKIFLFTLCLQITEWFLMLPNTPNHRWVFAFAAAIFLLSTKSNLKLGQLSKAFGLLLAIVYFYAGFAKLNADFLFEKHSCSDVFIKHVFLGADVPKFILDIAPSFVCALEIVLVLLILLPKTRIIASATALILHLGLALDIVKHFLDFSSVMSCLILTQAMPTRASILSTENIKKYAKYFSCLFIVLAFIRSKVFYQISLPQFAIILEVCWLFYYLFVALLFVKIIKIGSSTWSITDKNKLNFAVISILILATINGATAYLGLKTRSSFSMYSNLWIDDSGSNHLLVRKSPDIFGFLKDDIKIVSTNDLGELGFLQKENFTIPYIQLHSLVKSEPLIEIDYVRNNKVYSYPREELASPGLLLDNWLARKFIIFQASNPAVAEQCIW